MSELFWLKEAGTSSLTWNGHARWEEPTRRAGRTTTNTGPGRATTRRTRHRGEPGRWNATREWERGHAAAAATGETAAAGETTTTSTTGRAETQAEAHAHAAPGLVLREHGVVVGLALGGVRRGDGVDDGLGFFVANLLVVVDDVAQVVAAAVVGLAHAHAVVREVDIAVVAKDWEEGGKTLVVIAMIFGGGMG